MGAAVGVWGTPTISPQIRLWWEAFPEGGPVLQETQQEQERAPGRTGGSGGGGRFNRRRNRLGWESLWRSLFVLIGTFHG
jgi:hypothetical protein